MACCFFWFATAAFSCFCLDALLTDFGDLSPMARWFVEVEWKQNPRNGAVDVAFDRSGLSIHTNEDEGNTGRVRS